MGGETVGRFSRRPTHFTNVKATKRTAAAQQAAPVSHEHFYGKTNFVIY